MLNKDQYYTGTVVEIIDPVLYQIKVDIPGIAVSVKAFPMRGELDEPRVGDFVLLKSLDPVFNSYYLYQKIKENDFIGIRSNGKIVDITPDYVMLGIFDPTIEYNDRSENYRPDSEGNGMVTDWIKLDKDGNLTINLRANSNINIVTDSSITIGGNSSIEVGKDAVINVSGKTDITCPEITVTSSSKITLTGGGSLETGSGASCSPTSTGGFCGIPVCPFSGAPHVGNMISGI